MERWILQSVTVQRECLGAQVTDRIGVFFNRSESVFGVAGTSSSVSDRPAACALESGPTGVPASSDNQIRFRLVTFFQTGVADGDDR